MLILDDQQNQVIEVPCNDYPIVDIYPQSNNLLLLQKDTISKLNLLSQNTTIVVPECDDNLVLTAVKL